MFNPPDQHGHFMNLNWRYLPKYIRPRAMQYRSIWSGTSHHFFLVHPWAGDRWSRFAGNRWSCRRRWSQCFAHGSSAWSCWNSPVATGPWRSFAAIVLTINPLLAYFGSPFFCVSPSRGHLWENPDVDCSEEFYINSPKIDPLILTHGVCLKIGHPEIWWLIITVPISMTILYLPSGKLFRLGRVQ